MREKPASRCWNTWCGFEFFILNLNLSSPTVSVSGINNLARTVRTRKMGHKYWLWCLWGNKYFMYPHWSVRIPRFVSTEQKLCNILLTDDTTGFHHLRLTAGCAANTAQKTWLFIKFFSLTRHQRLPDILALSWIGHFLNPCSYRKWDMCMSCAEAGFLWETSRCSFKFPRVLPWQ